MGETMRSNKLNTSQSTSKSTAAKSSASRETGVKSLNLPKGKFKTDPQNADPYRFTKRKDLDQKYQINIDKHDTAALADHFIKSIDKKRRFAYEQRQADDLALRDKKSKLGDELRPYGLACPKLT